MKAVGYREVDGIRLVTEITSPTVDPEASLERARIEVAASGYQARFDDLVARGKHLDHTDDKAVAELKQDVAQYAFEHSIAVRGYATSHPIYFEHVNNEMLVHEDIANRLQDKLKKLNKNERLTIDENVIQDNRGRVYYYKEKGVWFKLKINRISQVKPEQCTWKEGLNACDIDEIRRQEDEAKINSLSLEERRTIANTEIEMAAKRCAQMRSVLEIKGDTGALDKAREQFERLKSDIIKRYKLSGDSNDGSETQTRPHDGGDPAIQATRDARQNER